jgi:tmRNA-binding protein
LKPATTERKNKRIIEKKDNQPVRYLSGALDQEGATIVPLPPFFKIADFLFTNR